MEAGLLSNIGHLVLFFFKYLNDKLLLSKILLLVNFNLLGENISFLLFFFFFPLNPIFLWEAEQNQFLFFKYVMSWIFRSSSDQFLGECKTCWNPQILTQDTLFFSFFILLTSSIFKKTPYFYLFPLCITTMIFPENICSV